ncbi:MAG: DUF4190 domain-containing protein [Ignavibacteria bacterium]|nr:DUF4190 domain-containing protein [Ignavibacteria bacterium]
MKEYSFFRQDSGSGNFPPSSTPNFNVPPPPSPPPGIQNSSPGTNSIISLVLGILSFLMCPLILGIAAWIMGKNEIKAIDNRQSPEAGRMLATIGKWLGIINVIFTIIGIIILIILLSLGILGGILDSVK